jgi:outer membrane protein assembly factor BamB
MKPLIFLVTGVLLYACHPSPPSVHEWRGSGRSGSYKETGLLREWPPEGPKELWYLEGIGNGYGSPVVAEDRIYITGAIDSTAWLWCLDLDGEPVWKSPFGKEFTENFLGSRSAPTVVDGLIYVGSGLGNLYCFDAKAGLEVWSKDLEVDFQGTLPRYGHSEAAAVDGDRVFWTPGGKEHNVVCLDRFSGKMLWSHPGFGERPAYHSPLVIRLPERTLLTVFTAYHFMGFDADTGEMLWSHEQENTPLDKRSPGTGDTHANTALFDGNALYYVEGDGNGTVRLDLSEDGSSINEKWRTLQMDGYMQGAVIMGEHLYGSGTRKKKLYSLDVRDGTLTDSLDIGCGAVIEADSMLYYYTWTGDMHLVRYDEGKLVPVSSFRIKRGDKEHFSHPVIDRGRLYQRHGDVLMAFDITAS